MTTKAWLVIAIQLVALGAPLFSAAGSLAWPAGWVFLAIAIGGSAMTNSIIARSDPALMTERNKPLMQRGQAAWDKLVVSSLVLIALAWLVVSGLDAVRFRWTSIPPWLQAVGGCGVGFAMWVRFRALRENTFLATVMRIQEDRSHRVISTGPYAIVRHPLYAGVLWFFPSSALLLGSWWGLAVTILPAIGLITRTAMEDRELQHRLDGYLAYASRVRYRLVPGIW